MLFIVFGKVRHDFDKEIKQRETTKKKKISPQIPLVRKPP